MPELYSPSKQTLGSLLTLTTPPIRVPDWQREYSWTRKEVEAFWLDLKAFSDRHPDESIQQHEYFLGSMVLVEAGESHLLLDGQQRLATATILLAVIRDYLTRHDPNAAARLTQDFIDRLDDSTGAHTYKLTLNCYDREFFCREVQTVPYPTPAPVAVLEAHELIRKAKVYLSDVFSEAYEGLNDELRAFQWALRVRRVLTQHMSVVVVKSLDEKSAETVFETLNDRGIGLSTTDLLRNHLLREAAPACRQEIVECWSAILAVSEDARVEEFLRHFWLSYHGDIKTRRLFHEITTTLRDAGTTPLDFSRQLRSSAEVYRQIVAASSDDPQIEDLLKAIRQLGAKALLPAVLSTLETRPADAVPLLSALTNLYVRHSLIGGLESTQLETIVYSLAQSLREGTPTATFLEQIRDFSPDDLSFRMAFATASISRTASARYLLEKLELDRRATAEIDVAPPHRVHVEHIYPRNPSFAKWEGHASIINRLGNLTLLDKKLNQQIQNGPYADKVDAFRTSELHITRELATLPTWDKDAISARQLQMAGRAASIWSLEPPAR